MIGELNWETMKDLVRNLECKSSEIFKSLAGDEIYPVDRRSGLKERKMLKPTSTKVTRI